MSNSESAGSGDSDTGEKGGVESPDSGTDPGSGDSADTSDTVASVDTADSAVGTPPPALDLNTDYDARIVGDQPNGTSWAPGPRLSIATGMLAADGRVRVAAGFPGYPGSGGAYGAAFVVDAPAGGEVSLAAADASLGAAGKDWIGDPLAVGDLDDDGTDDLVVFAPLQLGDYRGGAYFLLGPLAGPRDVSEATTSIVGEWETMTGWSGAITQDVDGDGGADVWIGAPGAAHGGGGSGAAFLFSGRSQGELGFADATAAYYGTDAGWNVGSGGDANGDGVGDLLVGQDSVAARIVLIYGPVSGDLTEANADATFAGAYAAGAADMDGDGYSDVIASDVSEGTGGEYAGAMYSWFAPSVVGEAASGADAAVYGGGPAHSTFGWSAAEGDVSGDDALDLLVGAPDHLIGAGGAWLFAGPIRGTLTSADAWAHFTGDSGDCAGYATALADLDADGLADVLIAGPRDDAGAGPDSGTVWITYATSL